MTELLEQVIAQLKTLPDEEQNAIVLVYLLRWLKNYF